MPSRRQFLLCSSWARVDNVSLWMALHHFWCSAFWLASSDTKAIHFKVLKLQNTTVYSNYREELPWKKVNDCWRRLHFFFFSCSQRKDRVRNSAVMSSKSFIWKEHFLKIFVYIAPFCWPLSLEDKIYFCEINFQVMDLFLASFFFYLLTLFEILSSQNSVNLLKCKISPRVFSKICNIDKAWIHFRMCSLQPKKK